MNTCATRRPCKTKRRRTYIAVRLMALVRIQVNGNMLCEKRKLSARLRYCEHIRMRIVVYVDCAPEYGATQMRTQILMPDS